MLCGVVLCCVVLCCVVVPGPIFSVMVMKNKSFVRDINTISICVYFHVWCLGRGP